MRFRSSEILVLVLGASDDAGHWLLSEVESGERFAFQGRVFDTADVDADGDLEIRATGDVVSRVYETHVRHSKVLIDLVVSNPDGTTETIVGTPEHPFWLAAADDYVPMGELVVGDVLRTVGGGQAVVAEMVWSEGDFEVFNFEVEGVQNYFVRAPGGDSAGCSSTTGVVVQPPSTAMTVEIWDPMAGT